MADNNSQPPTPNSYRPKYLRAGEVDAESLSQLLGYLANIDEQDRINLTFSEVLEHAPVSELKYTKESAFTGDENYQRSHLFRSDIALLFYDLIVSLDLEETLNDQFEELTPNNPQSLGKLVELKNSVANLAAKVHAGGELSREEEERLGSFFARGNIRTIANFFLNLLRQRPELEEELTGKEEDQEKEQPTTAEELAAAAAAATTEPTATPAATGEGAAPAEPTPTEPTPTQPTPPQPVSAPLEPLPKVDVLELKSKLFSREVREQTVRFTQVALVQLELFHGLPEGSLQNSPELRELLSEKTLGFFTNVLTQDRFDLLLTSPEERFRFIREYLWLVQNDFRVTNTIAKHLTEVVLVGADQATKAQIEEALLKAEQGEDTAPLIQGLAENPQIRQIITQLKAASPLFSQTPEVFNAELTKELQQQLKNAGVQTDKLGLAQTNIGEVIDAFIAQGLPPAIFDYVDEGRFELIFGRDIPYRPELLGFLQEYWLARRGTLGRKYGNVLLNVEARFATAEALALLDKNTTQIEQQQADEIFIKGVAEPTRDLLVTHKETKLAVEQSLEVEKSTNLKDDWEDYQKLYLQVTWNSLSQVEKGRVLGILGYGEPGSEAIGRLTGTLDFYPGELQYQSISQLLQSGEAPAYTQSAVDPVYTSPYMANNAININPLRSVRGAVEKSKDLKKIGVAAKKIGKGIRDRFSKKATEEAVEKVAQAGGSTLPGGPVTGWLAGQLATKEGRKRLAFLGTGGLGALALPLFSWGGRIGALIGGGLGLLAGPGASFVGAIIGGWTGLGIENLVRNFSGGEGLSFSFQSPSFGGFFDRILGGGTPPPPETAVGIRGAVAKAATSTGTQAVLATLGTLAAGSIFSHMVLNNALLADFPQVDPLGSISPGAQGRVSQYVTVEKRVFVEGCPQNKCENPAFPITAEYAIVIKPKDNYSIIIKEVNDSLRVNHSDQAWEEEGKTAPNIEEQTKTINDFSELYEGLTIGPGEEVAFSYTETFNEDYNHASILNSIEVVFDYATAEGIGGEDSAITGEVVYVGDYSQGVGCWPTNGTITQLPGGTYSHVNVLGQPVDAFDIANSAPNVPVFSPFGGELCTAHLDPGYGTHLTLKSEFGTVVFGHLNQTIFGKNEGCISDLTAGQFIGIMGNTGNSSGPHLHIELKGHQTNPSALGSLLPDGLTVRNGDPVRTCYQGG